MGFFKQRQNKRFNYKSRLQNDKDNTYKVDLESQWEDIKAANKRKKNIFTSPLFLVSFLIAVLILMYVLGRYE